MPAILKLKNMAIQDESRKILPAALMPPATHFRLVEVPITAGQGSQPTVTIADQPDLRYARILNIETYCADDLAYSFPQGIPLITAAMLPKLALTLETNDADITNQAKNINQAGTAGRFTATQENYQYVPLTSLHIIQGAAGTPFVRNSRLLWNTFVTWQKSKINLPNQGLGNNTTVCVCLGVWFTWVDIFGNPIERT